MASRERDAPQPGLDEPMLAAREAAYVVNLPAYWLVDAQQRRRLDVPHYRIGNLLRFRASELERWAQRLAANGGSDA